MKKSLLSVLAVSAIMIANGQLKTGDISPDWTMNDYLGNGPFTMSDYLDQGKTVYIDISATWCGPCWNFHQTGVLEELYELHGPAGAPGVDPGTTDDVMVFFFEGDAETTNADLLGTGSNTRGDWTAGVSLPIMDGQAPVDYANAIRLNAFPTMIKICPDRSVEMFNPGNQTASSLYSKRTSCGGLSSATNDAKFAINFTPSVDYCEGTTPKAKVKIQNYGSSALNSATINVYNGTTVLGTANWSGSLAQYEAEVITINLTNVTGDYTITKFEIAESDDNNTNNTLNTSIVIKKAPISGKNMKLRILTDGYGDEFGYILRKGDNLVSDIYTEFFNLWGSGAVSTMLNYYGTEYGSENSIDDETEWEMDFELTDGCHMFAFRDSYGDGLTDPDNGFIKIITPRSDGGEEVIWEKTSGVWSELFIAFDVDGSNSNEFVSVENIEAINSLKLYPNPTNGNSSLELNLIENSTVNVNVLNTLGQVVFNKTLTNVSGNKKITIDTQNFESGLYFVNIKAGDITTTKKLTVTK